MKKKLLRPFQWCAITSSIARCWRTKSRTFAPPGSSQFCFRPDLIYAPGVNENGNLRLLSQSGSRRFITACSLHVEIVLNSKDVTSTNLIWKIEVECNLTWTLHYNRHELRKACNKCKEELIKRRVPNNYIIKAFREVVLVGVIIECTYLKMRCLVYVHS